MSFGCSPDERQRNPGTAYPPDVASLIRATIVERLHAAFKTIVAKPEFERQLARMGLIAIDSPPPDELQRFLLAEIDRWGKLVRDVGIAGTE